MMAGTGPPLAESGQSGPQSTERVEGLPTSQNGTGPPRRSYALSDGIALSLARKPDHNI